MEQKRNSENSGNSNLELVLEQFTLEQKSQTKSISELALSVDSLSEQVNNFKKEIQNPRAITVSTNTIPIQEMINKAIIDIKLIIAAGQKSPVPKKYQLLLFPERDAKLFYKIVFGRWIIWLTVMLALTNIYKYCVHSNDNQKEVNLQLIQNDRIKKSWDYLYSLHSKTLKKLMDTAYYRQH